MPTKNVDMTGLPRRPSKPRGEGLTYVLDKGLSLREVEDLLDVSATYIDVVKLGWGTSVITPRLEEKLGVYREAGVDAYLGGTLFEAFYLRGEIDRYLNFLRGLDIGLIEVSDGSIEIDHSEKTAIISRLSDEFVVLSEVGSKDADHITPPYRWVEMIHAELRAGSERVICEARESGTVGLFRPNGEVREGLVDEIVDMVGKQRVVFEAPRKAQQVWFLKHLGPNVNLANIAPSEVLPLETLRLGQRGDTLLDFYQEGTAASELRSMKGEFGPNGGAS
ncbi:MAG: phosphosulfolactate synthase [Rhodothermales bacterium]|nr:phosphosulfolactate synthase [Rhodothermales bacterium]